MAVCTSLRPVRRQHAQNCRSGLRPSDLPASNGPPRRGGELLWLVPLAYVHVRMRQHKYSSVTSAAKKRWVESLWEQEFPESPTSLNDDRLFFHLSVRRFHFGVKKLRDEQTLDDSPG